MTGTITYILSRAGYRAMNGPLADERRRLAGAEPPAAYVSYDPRLLAGAGWYGYRIALKGGERQMTERARYMLSERYVIRDGSEYYADGVYVFGVLLRERVPHYGIGGGAPTPEPEALNFYMPNGGTISLNKTGNPTVVELEYSIDRGQTWTVWQEDANGNRSLTLTVGQRMYVRNTSETQTRFSTSENDYYHFVFTSTAEAHGNTNSLLCKNADSVTTLSASCYQYMFYGCTSLVSAPELPATTLATECYRSMFNGCISLTEIRTMMINISASNCLTNWLYDIDTSGDFYCPASLTIPSGASGIPSGWIRHDI